MESQLPPKLQGKLSWDVARHHGHCPLPLPVKKENTSAGCKQSGVGLVQLTCRMKSHAEHQGREGDKHQMWDHRRHPLQRLGTPHGDTTPSTHTDTSEVSHLPAELSLAQGFSAAVPGHRSSQQGHSCSWDSCSRLPFPPDQTQHGDEPMFCHYLLLLLNCLPSIAGLQQHTLRKGSGAPAATAQPTGTLTS